MTATDKNRRNSIRNNSTSPTAQVIGLAVNNAVGNEKQASSDPDVRAEGDRQELKGDAQNAKGKIKGVINDL